jgi:hypothetical protein
MPTITYLLRFINLIYIKNKWFADLFYATYQVSGRLIGRISPATFH